MRFYDPQVYPAARRGVSDCSERRYYKLAMSVLQNYCNAAIAARYALSAVRALIDGTSGVNVPPDVREYLARIVRDWESAIIDPEWRRVWTKDEENEPSRRSA